MATTIDSRDHCTAGHSHRVARYARKLLQIAALDPSATHGIKIKEPELHEIYYAGLLHDVGKIGVREEVLTKSARLPSAHIELIGLRLTLWGRINDFPWEDDLSRLERINRAYELANDDIEFIKRLSGELLEIGGKTTTILSRDEAERLLTPWGNLTRKEWEEIKRHPTESQRILANIPFSNFFPKLPTMILQHHERLDGSGYPHGVKGDEILLQSRVLAIVDVYDSLRRDRHYKKAQPKSMALKILREEAALNKLDPLLVEIFCENVDLIEEPAHMDLYIPPYQACPQ
jgi:HD-GYP domain-containing protein (c-di-GMP phosphodiesterase class II)